MATIGLDRLEEMKEEIFEQYDLLYFEPGFDEFKENLRKELQYRKSTEIL